jgi:nucleotide-binding universal stress UspA family protein
MPPAMDRLSDEDARALLGLPMAYMLPATEIIAMEAGRIVETNLALARELLAQGIRISPIWERKGSRAAVRAAMLPAEFASRYFTGGGLVVIGKPGVRTLVAELMPFMAEDPAAAAVALEDTLEVWTFEGAPLHPVESPYGGHYKLLSLMLADIARKADAGLDTLDWIASLGLPVEEFRDDDDPEADAIHARMEARMDAMWAQEDAWLASAPS